MTQQIPADKQLLSNVNKTEAILGDGFFKHFNYGLNNSYTTSHHLNKVTVSTDFAFSLLILPEPHVIQL